LLRCRRRALDDAIVEEFDGPDGDLKSPFLATAPDPQRDVPIQLLVEETEDGPSGLAFERLAIDAQQQVALLQAGRRSVETGRQAGDLAQGIQVHTQKGKPPRGAFDLIAGVAENRLVGRHFGTGDVPAEEAFVRAPRDVVDDANQIFGVESAAA